MLFLARWDGVERLVDEHDVVFLTRAALLKLSKVWWVLSCGRWCTVRAQFFNLQRLYWLLLRLLSQLLFQMLVLDICSFYRLLKLLGRN